MAFLVSKVNLEDLLGREEVQISLSSKDCFIVEHKVTGILEAKQNMHISQGNYVELDNLKYYGEDDFTLSDMCLDRHSPINEIKLTFIVVVPDRVHTHIRTHNVLQRHYVCSTSRPDWTIANGEYRLVKFVVDLSRAIEISERRLCKEAWKETRIAWGHMMDTVEDSLPQVAMFCKQPCVQRGMCTNVRSSCLYTNTAKYLSERKKLLEYSQSRKIKHNRNIQILEETFLGTSYGLVDYKLNPKGEGFEEQY